MKKCAYCNKPQYKDTLIRATTYDFVSIFMKHTCTHRKEKYRPIVEEEAANRQRAASCTCHSVLSHVVVLGSVNTKGYVTETNT